jgi:hypothetical protein
MSIKYTCVNIKKITLKTRKKFTKFSNKDKKKSFSLKKKYNNNFTISNHKIIHGKKIFI